MAPHMVLYVLLKRIYGGNIGIKKHLTVMGHITFGCDSAPIIKLLFEKGVISLDNCFPKMINRKTKVLVNGRWIGIVADPQKLVNELKLYRQNGLINIFTSISWKIDLMEISILTDGGRCCRPLYVMEDDKLLITPSHIDKLKSNKIIWNNLISGLGLKSRDDIYKCDYVCPTLESDDSFDIDYSKLKKERGVIEYIDADEAHTLLKTINDDESESRFSHCEIHSSLIWDLLVLLSLCQYYQALKMFMEQDKLR